MPRGMEEILVGLGRTLRHAGVDASPERVQAMVEAVGQLDVTDQEQVYWAGRVTLCSRPEDLPRYDAAFALYFSGSPPRAERRNPQLAKPKPLQMPAFATDPGSGEEKAESPEDLAAKAAEQEVLRHRDVADLSPEDREELMQLFALLAPACAVRPSRRWRAEHRGDVDARRSIRQALRNGGELSTLAHRRRRTRPRRVVILADVSGSMEPYAEAVLRFAHAAVRRNPAYTEVFTLGTRLTRVTRELRERDPERALRGAGHAIPDWSGGTRLGEMLRAFLDRWGQRGTARQAVAVVVSDGWERGDPTLLGEQMQRLARLAYRVVWVNPHKGHVGYQPLTGGMAAALPHVDEFVAGHSFEAFRELAEVMARA